MSVSLGVSSISVFISVSLLYLSSISVSSMSVSLGVSSNSVFISVSLLLCLFISVSLLYLSSISVSLSRCLFYISLLSLSLYLGVSSISLCDFISVSSQSQSHIVTDGQSVSKSWCRAPSGAHDQIFITVRQLRSCFCCVAPSLTRGRVCLLYMLLALASAVFLGSESPGTVSDLRLPLSSPPTTRRVTVEVFDPACFSVSYLSPLKYSVCVWNRRHPLSRLHFPLLRFRNNLVS
jgi:hypothetical protein